MVLVLSPDHIFNSLEPILQTPVYQSLFHVVQLMSSGKVCYDVQLYICGAFLTALTKKCGGIRPVACGDYLRRLTGKVLICAAKEDATNYLFPYQCGIGVKSGTELIAHSWRELMEKAAEDANFVGLKVDLDNTYNRAKRYVILTECRQVFPSLFAFAWFCYGNPSILCVRGFGEQILSQEGVQQGCPLAGLLFCLLVHRLAVKVNNVVPTLSLNSWFIDDGSLLGKVEDVEAGLNVIIAEACWTNLKLVILCWWKIANEQLMLTKFLMLILIFLEVQ